MQDMPYFMKEKKWYRFDFEKHIFVLTKFATDKAKESYSEYIEARKNKIVSHG